MKLAREKGISPLEASTFDIEWNGEMNEVADEKNK
jgi:hypothetical protein